MKRKEQDSLKDFHNQRNQFRGGRNNNFNNRKRDVPADAYFPGGKRGGGGFNNRNRELPPDVYRPGKPMGERFRDRRPFPRERRELPADVYIPGRQPFGGMDRNSLVWGCYFFFISYFICCENLLFLACILKKNGRM